MNEKQHKELSIREFTKAADVYDSGHADIYANSFRHYPNPQAFFDEAAFSIQQGSALDARRGTMAIDFNDLAD